MNNFFAFGGSPTTNQNNNVKSKIEKFIEFLKESQDNNESKNNTLNEIKKEIIILLQRNEIPEEKQDYVIEKITKLQQLDKLLLENIEKYQKGLASYEKKSGVKPILDLKYELFKLDVNAIRLLLQKLNLSSSGIDDKFKELLDITKQKIEIVNEIIEKDFDESKMSAEVFNSIENVLGNTNLSNIPEEEASKIKENVQDFLGQAVQRGGNKESDFKTLLGKFTLLFSFFKTDILLKVVFLAGYYNELKKQEIKNHISDVFKFYFIDRTDEFEDFYISLSEKAGFDFSKFIEDTNKTYQSIYKSTEQRGGNDEDKKNIIKLNLIGGTPKTTKKESTSKGDVSKTGPEQTTERPKEKVSTTKATAEEPKEKVSTTKATAEEPKETVAKTTPKAEESLAVSAESKKVFIPVILGLITQLQETNIDFLLSKQSIIQEFLTLIVENFAKFLNGKYYDNLKSDALIIDEEYKRIIDEKKVVLTFIKERQDSNPNPRFNINPKNKPSGSIIELEYKENNNEIKEGEKFNYQSKTNFYLGPFDKYYKNADNEDVAKEINAKIKTQLLNGESYCIIGYGQSGSGKTSTLIQLQLKNENRDGVLLELLKDKDIKDNYEVKISGLDIRTTYNETATGEDRYDLAELPVHEYSYNESKKNWLNKKSNVPESDANHTLPGYIIQKIDNERPIFPTPNNIKSSRSHMIIKIEAILKSGNNSGFKSFVLFVCDLAGFENEFKCGNGIEISRFFNQYKARLDKNDPEELFDRRKCKEMKLYMSNYLGDDMITEIGTIIDNFNAANVDKKISIAYGSIDQKGGSGKGKKTDPKSTTGTPKTDPKSTVKTDPKSTAKTDPKSTTGTPKTDPKSTTGTVKTDPKSTTGTVKTDPKSTTGTSQTSTTTGVSGYQKYLNQQDGICDFLQFKVTDKEGTRNIYTGDYQFLYSDIHKYDVTNSEWNKKVSSAAGANKEIPSDKLEAMSTFLGKMNGVMSDKSTLEMIQYLGTFSTRDLNPDNIKSKLDQRYKNAIDFNKKYEEGIWDSAQYEKKSESSKLKTSVLKGNQAENKALKEKMEKEIKSKLENLKATSKPNDATFEILNKMFPNIKSEFYSKFMKEEIRPDSKVQPPKVQSWLRWEFNNSELESYFKNVSSNLEKVKSVVGLFDKSFNLGETFGVFIKYLTKTNTPEMEKVNIDIFGEDKGTYYEISNVGKDKINERFKVENPEKIVIEHIILKVMTQNCKLRVVEGKMINDSLLEMKEQIKNMIIDSAGIPETSLYWDTLYHPYCYNLNIMSNKVFVKPERSEVNSSVIVNNLKKLTGGKDVKFIVFTVLNTNSDKNNPPNPPFYNLNNAKFYYLNSQFERLKKEMGKILNKAKNDPFYATNEFIAKKKADDIDKNDFKAFMEIFDRNNSATLIGTLDATEELQKLNMKYMCQESSNKKKLLDLFSQTFSGLLTIRGDGEYSRKYQINTLN